jgi:hypothetical protein
MQADGELLCRYMPIVTPAIQRYLQHHRLIALLFGVLAE